MNLKDKNILVTGASGGIGRAVAIALAQKKAVVAVHYNSDLTGGEETLAQVNKYSKGMLCQANLSDQNQTSRMFTLLGADMSTVDMIVNNAGRAQAGDFTDNTYLKHQFDNILLPTIHTTQEFLKHSKSESKRIINITSLFGNFDTGSSEYIYYSAMKAALNSLTVTLAKKYKGKILVNAVAPGYTWTPAWEGTSETEKQKVANETLIKRFIKPEEVAQATVSLLENDAITGQILTIDGGTSLSAVS